MTTEAVVRCNHFVPGACFHAYGSDGLGTMRCVSCNEVVHLRDLIDQFEFRLEVKHGR